MSDVVVFFYSLNFAKILYKFEIQIPSKFTLKIFFSAWAVECRGLLQRIFFSKVQSHVKQDVFTRHSPLEKYSCAGWSSKHISKCFHHTDRRRQKSEGLLHCFFCYRRRSGMNKEICVCIISAACVYTMESIRVGGWRKKLGTGADRHRQL